MREIFSDRHRLQGMLDFEAALARALARAGVAPESALEPIVAQCRADLFAPDVLAREAALAGNLAIPLVKALTAAVAKSDPKAAGFVHWGATSQDAIDTGLVLQLRAALDLMQRELAAIFGNARARRRNASCHTARRPNLAAAREPRNSGSESCRMARCRSSPARAYRTRTQ